MGLAAALWNTATHGPPDNREPVPSLDEVTRAIRRARRCYERAIRLPLRSNGRAKKEAEAAYLVQLAVALGAQRDMEPVEVAALAGLSLVNEGQVQGA